MRALVAPAAPGEPDIPLDSIRVTLRRLSESALAFDTTYRVRGDTLPGDSVVLLLTVPLSQSPEVFDLDVQAFGAGIIWYRLTTTLTIREGDNPVPPAFTARYVGPGVNASRVQMLPADTTATGGESFALHAVVYDSSNGPIAGVPVGYRLSDATRGSVNVSFLTATFTGAANVRDSVWVIAETPTRLRDSARVHILPPAATLQKVSGDLQTGGVNTALSAPLLVRVLDALGGPSQGKTVSWGVTAGAATLSAATTTSDANGLGSVTVTPTAAGPITVQAAAAGLAGSPVAFTASAVSVAPLLHWAFDSIGVGRGQIFIAQYVYVNTPVTGAPLVVQLAKSDSLQPPANQAFTLGVDSVVIPIGEIVSQVFDITGQELNGALLIARATGYPEATAMVTVTQPRLVVGTPTLGLPVGGAPVPVFVLTADESGSQHVVAAPLTVGDTSSDPTIVQADSATRVIPTRSGLTSFDLVGLRVGSAQVVFSAPGYTPDTVVVSVDTGQLQIVNPPLALGPKQLADDQAYVQLPFPVTSPLTVTLTSSDTTVLTVSDTVVIPQGLSFAFFDITGVGIGTATINATAPGLPPAAPVTVRVSTPRLSLSLAPSAIAGVDNSLAVFTADSLGVPRTVTETVTVTLGTDNPARVTFDSTPIHVATGALVALSGVRFDTAGTYLVIASAPGYTADTVPVAVTSALVIASDNQFTPDTLTVPAGQTVLWFNAGSSPHTTTSDTGVTPAWDSGNLAQGGMFQVFFSTPGTYLYHCTIHGTDTTGMRGVVIVTP